MSADTARGLIFAALMIHGFGHGGALGALAWIALRPGDPTGGWQAARSWLMPALPMATATSVASGFWLISMVGFVAAALSFWGIVLPGEAWRPLAIGSAIVSLAHHSAPRSPRSAAAAWASLRSPRRTCCRSLPAS